MPDEFDHCQAKDQHRCRGDPIATAVRRLGKCGAHEATSSRDRQRATMIGLAEPLYIWLGNNNMGRETNSCRPQPRGDAKPPGHGQPADEPEKTVKQLMSKARS